MMARLRVPQQKRFTAHYWRINQLNLVISQYGM